MSTAVTQVEVIIPTQTTYLSLIGSIGDHLVKDLIDFSGDQEELANQLNLVLTEATANVIKGLINQKNGLSHYTHGTLGISGL